MQVHGHDAVSASGLVEVCHEAGGDRLAAAPLLILACVWVERRDHGDAAGGSTLERIDHDELFHEPVVHRERMGLDHEAFFTANGIPWAYIDLAVGEVVRRNRREFSFELVGDLLCQLWVGTAGSQNQFLVYVVAQFRHCRLSVLLEDGVLSGAYISAANRSSPPQKGLVLVAFCWRRLICWLV